MCACALSVPKRPGYFKQSGYRVKSEDHDVVKLPCVSYGWTCVLAAWRGTASLNCTEAAGSLSQWWVPRDRALSIWGGVWLVKFQWKEGNAALFSQWVCVLIYSFLGGTFSLILRPGPLTALDIQGHSNLWEIVVLNRRVVVSHPSLCWFLSPSLCWGWGAGSSGPGLCFVPSHVRP